MRIGSKHSEETKLLSSKSHKGQHSSSKTEFKKGHISWNKGLRGITKFSEKTRKKMSETRKGHFTSEETRRKISEAQKGKTWKEIFGEEEAEKKRKLMSEAKKGRFTGKNSPSWKENKKIESIQGMYRHKARTKLLNLGYNINNKIVHHIDGNWKNNDINNLQILNSIAEHTKLHSEQRRGLKL